MKSKFNRGHIVVLSSVVVTLVGLLVMIGWRYDVAVFKSIHPGMISMKFDTALCFFLSGITLYFIMRSVNGENDTAMIIISLNSLVVLLLMGTMFFAAIFGIKTGTENLFINDINPSTKTVIPGLPSFTTMINFLLIGITGILTISKINKLKSKLKFIGFVIAIIGGLAVVGYILNVEFLFYYIPDLNSAMALHTASLFVIFGIGLICL